MRHLRNRTLILRIRQNLRCPLHSVIVDRAEIRINHRGPRRAIFLNLYDSLRKLRDGAERRDIATKPLQRPQISRVIITHVVMLNFTDDIATAVWFSLF